MKFKNLLMDKKQLKNFSPLAKTTGLFLFIEQSNSLNHHSTFQGKISEVYSIHKN